MSEFDDKINQLQQRLEALAKYQEDARKEIVSIHFEIKSLKAMAPPTKVEIKADPQKPPVKEESPKPPVREYIPPSRTHDTGAEKQTAESHPPPPQHEQQKQQRQSPPPPQPQTPPLSNYASQTYQPQIKSDIEKFIGENLISKIGIVITVLGVAIGTKYAIDNELISPLGRIILGYLFAFGLLGVAVRLKEKYLNFSAVLLSGAMAIHCFITFAAYSFYGLISQKSAFALMLIFTVFTVAAAVKYNRQVIAHFGLVGAYTIPFLLSDGSGNYAFLFSYISIINVGILAICIKKYWKPLYYSSFIVTWATFFAWHLMSYRAAEHFSLAMTFSAVFFFIFYVTFLAYKIINKERFTPEIIFLVLANSFIFYGFGYSTIKSQTNGEQFLGLFTVINAFIHFAAGFIISRFKLAERKDVHLLTALFMTFITIAVPVQFSGNWVTLLWAAEATVLFCLGRTKGVSLYEYFSYPLMILASISLLNDWQTAAFNSLSAEFLRTPIFNGNFLTAILFVTALAAIYFVNKDERYETTVNESIIQIAWYAIPTVLLLALYNTFRIEVGNYWHAQLVTTAAQDLQNNLYLKVKDLNAFNFIWQLNYSMCFLIVLSLANIKKIKSSILAFINLGLNVLILPIFLSGGLYMLGELRESRLTQTGAELFGGGTPHALTRYACFVFVAGVIWAIYKYTKQEFLQESLANFNFGPAFDFVLHVSVLVIASNELLNQMDIFGFRASYHLGLNLLWNSYALFLVFLGIDENKKHLRFGAIALFLLALGKLLFYDYLITGNSLHNFRIIWQINYSIFFLIILSAINIKKIKDAGLGLVNLVLNTVLLLIFLTLGLYLLSELRENYLSQTNAVAFQWENYHILVRYVSYGFVAALLAATYEYIKQEFLTRAFPGFDFKLAFDFVFYFSLLVIVSSELINLMDIFGFAESYKLGLSILWGCYALFLVALGISKNKKHLRIGAMVLFALTLVKLFFYDIVEMETIAKTVVFVSLGILLLIISFLYNKYKHLIFEPNET